MRLARIGKILVCVGGILVFIGLAVSAHKTLPRILFSVVAFGFAVAIIGFAYEFVQKSRTRRHMERS